MLHSVTIGHSMVTSALGVVGGSRSYPLRFDRMAVILMGGAGGN